MHSYEILVLSLISMLWVYSIVSTVRDTIKLYKENERKG